MFHAVPPKGRGNIDCNSEFPSGHFNHEPKRECQMLKTMISLILLSSIGQSWAQSSQPPANRDANTPAVNSPNSPPNPGAPVAGANSFTEGQAKSRIEDRGFIGALSQQAGISDEEANVYAEGPRRGGALVSAKVDDAEASRIQPILDRSSVRVADRAADSPVHSTPALPKPRPI